MTRLDNWPRLLNAFITKEQTKQYEMGVHDCCTFAAGAVQAITGEDLMEEFRGKYDADTWEDALASIGQGDLLKTLIHKLGSPIHGAKGQRGDVAYHEGRCGVVIGRYALFIYQDGFGTIPMTAVQRVFKVGH